MRRLLSRVAVSALVGVLVAGVAWALGVPLLQSAVILVCVVVLGATRGVIEVHQHASGSEQWRGRWSPTRDGGRRDVRQLGWQLSADNGRVHGAAVHRLRLVAANRLGRHGIDLTDPAQAAAAEALLGTTAYRVVTATAGQPVRYPAYVRAVDALERLPTVPTSAATTSPSPSPEPR